VAREAVARPVRKERLVVTSSFLGGDEGCPLQALASCGDAINSRDDEMMKGVIIILSYLVKVGERDQK
jgi:hypothetical protein